jgi:hypothetical protein
MCASLLPQVEPLTIIDDPADWKSKVSVLADHLSLRLRSPQDTIQHTQCSTVTQFPDNYLNSASSGWDPALYITLMSNGVQLQYNHACISK